MHSSCGQNRSDCLNTAEEAVLELAAAVPACSPSDSMHAVQFGGRLLETYSADCFCCPPMILKPQTKFAPPERITLQLTPIHRGQQEGTVHPAPGLLSLLKQVPDCGGSQLSAGTHTSSSDRTYMQATVTGIFDIRLIFSS